jgi:citrate synthase
MTTWITAEAAARRLGVKRATLYAYVSRGVLVRKRAPDGRGSLFDAREIDRLATRGRPRGAPGGSGFVIESALTEITDDALRYRGHDVTTLAATRTLEEAATLLWTGTLPPHPGPTWRATPEAIAVGSAAQSALPPRALPLERLQVIVPALAAADPLRLHLDAPAVITAARAMIAGMVDCLPAAPPAPVPAAHPGPVPAAPPGPHPHGPAPTDPEAGPGPADRQAGPGMPARGAGPGPADGQAGPGRAAREAGPGRAAREAGAGIAERLWPKLCPHPPAPGLLAALRAALVLLADHELAASTLAARVAASVRADPYAVVATGLGAVSGPLHGGASLGAENMLAAAATPGDAPRVVGDLLRLTGRVPGFGHLVYKAGDPRAVFLLGLIASGAPGSPRLAIADALLAEMRQRSLPAPNIDFALALLKDSAGMISGAGEAIFAVARTSGWIAHALEEYARATPLRPRAVYTGPPPS